VEILQQILMATGILGEEWKHRMVAKQLRVATLTTNFAGLFFDYYIFISKSLISMWLKTHVFFFRIFLKNQYVLPEHFEIQDFEVVPEFSVVPYFTCHLLCIPFHRCSLHNFSTHWHKFLGNFEILRGQHGTSFE
jgi:hypothetical protein